MDKWKRTTDGFNYVYEKEFDASESDIIRMPPVSPNKRGVNDIGWQSDGDVTIYGTLSSDPENTQMWQEIEAGEEINKTVSALKIVNNGAACSVVVRIIMC